MVDDAITGDHPDLWPSGQIIAGARGKPRIGFDRGHLSFGTDQFRQDRALVAGARADVQRPLARVGQDRVE